VTLSLAAVNLEPPSAQFAPAGSVAEVTLTPSAPSVPSWPASPCGPVWLQLICVAVFGQFFNGVEPIAMAVKSPFCKQPV
jgi:hypothetical protein